MTYRTWRLAHLLTPAFLLASCSAAMSANLYWEGNGTTGELTGPNYFNFDATLSAQQPGTGDVVAVGFNGTANHTTPGLLELQKLRIGHNGVTGQTAHNGPGTVTIGGGAQVKLTAGAAGAANASLWVGNVQNGTLNIDGAGTSVTSARLIIIGYGNNQNRTGTVNITNGGSLVATLGNITMGEGTGANKNGVKGVLNVSGGTVSVMDAGADLIVGNDVATCTVTQSGGLIEVADQIIIGRGGSTGSSYTMSSGTTTTGGSFFVGRGLEMDEASTSDGGSVNATLNVSGDAVLNVGVRLLIGSSTLGNPPGSVHQATGATANQTGGTVNTTADVRVGDANANGSAYNFSGGTINSTTGGFVGRQGSGVFTQTGGVANFNGTLHVGNRDGAFYTANGLYKISAGELNAGANSGGVGLTVGAAGVGQFRVVGDDASIDILGSLNIGATADGVGTLAFEFEAGESLSMVNVANTATFSSGAKLVLDSTLASPSLQSYDLLTALDIDDQGLIFEGPAGWTTQIVAGGSGEILRAMAPGGQVDNADFNGDGTVDGADLLAWQRGFGGAPTLANGNANGDGAVDAADLAIWKGQFGASSTAVAAAVPEPCSLLLAFSAAAVFSASCARKRRLGVSGLA